MSRPQAKVRRVVVKFVKYWRMGDANEDGRLVLSYERKGSGGCGKGTAYDIEGQ